ncbi:MAG: tRNA pseudouridine(55) synthase TruB [Bacteroidaceae bacterium]|nr:tRNA pseudouridine(55) synthase TruB [Bacteroidaceae bacterium]
MNFAEGEILYFDKPYRWTSFNLVACVRNQLCRRLGVKKLKVGHAGTLDPLATGVLTICTGKATKRIDELQAHTKEYVATLQFGATTPSYDLEKPVDATFPTEHINRGLLLQTLETFRGHIEQVPPTFSACKVNGKRAYELARKGKDVELKPKVLVIDEIELLQFDAQQMQATLRIVCSKGTYIRALARDIGLALHSGAHLIALRRTRVGNVRVEDCMQVDDFPAWLDAQSLSPSPAPKGREEQDSTKKLIANP